MIQTKNLTYDIIDRVISIPLTTNTFAVMGDNVSRYLTFRISRYIDNVDLSLKKIYICYKTSTTTTGESVAVNLKYSNSILEFDWAIPSEVTDVNGSVEFYIEFREVDEENKKIYCLKTKSITQDVEMSFNVENTATAKDYSFEKLFLESNTTHINRPDIIDGDLPFKIIDRDILMDTKKVVAVMKDNMSQILSFRLKRKIDGVDRADKTFCFKFMNANGETDIALASNVFVYEDEISIGWILDSKVTSYSGTVSFVVSVLGKLDDDSLYSWNSKMAQFTIEGGLDVDTSLPQPSQSWYNSWIIEADNILQNSAINANKAKDYYLSADNINKAIIENTKIINQQSLIVQSNTNLTQDAISVLTDLYAVRSSKDDTGVFTVVKYYRSDGMIYMTSTLNSVTDTYDQRIEVRYDVDGATILSTKIIPIIRDLDGIVVGRMGNLSQLQYHGLI